MARRHAARNQPHHRSARSTRDVAEKPCGQASPRCSVTESGGLCCPPDQSRRRDIDLVIIPAFNEASALPAVLEALHVEAPELDVVVVDDGSTDATADVARRTGVVVLRLPFNLGIGGALRTGFRYAVEHSYDRAVQLDADGQHDPALVRLLLDGLANADLVIGSRFADEAAVYDAGRTRRGAMWMLQCVLRLLSGREFSDTSSGFRAFGRPVLELFATTYPAEYLESVEALLSAHYRGFRIIEIPTQMRRRAAGRASNRHLKLGYHYCRLIIHLLVTAQRQPRESST